MNVFVEVSYVMVSNVTSKAGNNFDHRRTWLVDKLNSI